MAATKRLFIAIPVCDRLKKELIDFQKSLQEQGIKGRVIKPEQFHMTLVFLGGVNENDVDKIQQVMDQIHLPEVSLESCELTLFSKTLVLRFTDNEQLKQAVSELKHSLKEAGFTFDDKSFKPHITLFRNCTGFSRNIKQNIKFIYEVKRVILYQSLLKPEGPVYLPLYIQDLERQ